MTRFSFKQLYLYGICTVALLIGVFGAIQLTQHIVNIALPDSSSVPPSNLYDRRGIITSVVQILIALPLYLYHWRLARSTES